MTEVIDDDNISLFYCQDTLSYS